MNEQAKVNPVRFEIAADETCLWCDASREHLRHGGVSDEWHVGMRCQMLHCDVCDNEFGVSCDEILEDGSLLHDHGDGFLSEFGAQS